MEMSPVGSEKFSIALFSSKTKFHTWFWKAVYIQYMEVSSLTLANRIMYVFF